MGRARAKKTSPFLSEAGKSHCRQFGETQQAVWSAKIAYERKNLGLDVFLVQLMMLALR